MVVSVELPSEIAEVYAEARSRICFHTKFAHGYEMPKHQHVWAAALEDFSIPRLLIVAPPKYGKSPVVGLDYLGWRIGNDPEGYHCIYVSNTAGQAQKYSVALRDTIAFNENYRTLYRLEPDTYKGWSEREWFVKRKNQADKDPTVQACGVYGPILGATVQEVIFDDVADDENMATAYQREKTLDWLRTTPMSRLVPSTGRAVMICTRWHDDDPASAFEKDGWVVIQIPAIDEEGDSTYPSYWPLDALADRKVDLGTWRFELMFQGRVLPAEGGIFKKEWWRYWRQGEAPWQLQGGDKMPIRAVIQSWDTAFKEKQQNDWSVCETWAILDNGYYLLDCWYGKMVFPDLKKASVSVWEQHQAYAVLIEDAASGQDLIAELRANSVVPVIPITVDRDKVARAHAVTPMIEAGKVFIPEDAPWRPQWQYNHEVFPKGSHDDDVDATTQFLNWARKHAFVAPTISGVEKKSTWEQLR